MLKKLSIVVAVAVVLLVIALSNRTNPAPASPQNVVTKVSDDGMLTLSIPKEALPAGVSPDDIRMEAYGANSFPYAIEGSTAPMHAYKLLPDGLTFTSPVTATFAYTAEKAVMPVILHASKDKVEIPTSVQFAYDTETKKVDIRVPLTHFSGIAFSAEQLFEMETQPSKKHFAVNKPIYFVFTMKPARKTLKIIGTDDEGKQTEYSVMFDTDSRYNVRPYPGVGSSFIGKAGIMSPRTWLKERLHLQKGTEYEEYKTISCTAAGKEDYAIDKPLSVDYSVIYRQENGVLPGSQVVTFSLTYTDHYVCGGEQGSSSSSVASSALSSSMTTSSQASSAAAVTNQKYYVVKANDPTGDTGNEVCAKVGKTCVGYTDLSLATCLKFHPNALTSEDFNGSKAGFFCNGAPQGGICAKEANTCHICPQCNLNMQCDTVIGDLYNETFVECQ